jgi:integrase
MRPRPPVVPRGALKLTEVGEMLRRLDDAGLRETTKAGIKMLIYTGLRDFSLRAARWEEIDFVNAMWTIPAERMKARKGKKKPHVVPLPRQALAVLRELATDPDPHAFIFPGAGGHMAEKTLSTGLRSLGFDGVTAHGCRSLITDFCYEAGFRSEAIEAQMSHQLGTISRERREAVGQLDPSVRAAYLRSPFLDLRIVMMQYWADVLDSLKADQPMPQVLVDNVVRIKRPRAA